MLNEKFKICENGMSYVVTEEISEREIIAFANFLAAKKLKRGQVLTSPNDCRIYLQKMLCDVEHEIFGVVFLTNQNQVIVSKELFRGSISSASVYPREVVKEVLARNAAAVLFYHNHPSGNPEPSMADRAITTKLVSALNVIDVRVLDHLIVGSEGTVSFAERGIL